MLKKKVTAFKPKPKARPKVNGTSSQTPSERQTPIPILQEPQLTEPEQQPEIATVQDEQDQPAQETSHASLPGSVSISTDPPTITSTIHKPRSKSSSLLIPQDTTSKSISPSLVPRNIAEITAVPSSETITSNRTEPVPEDAPTSIASTEPSSATVIAPVEITATTDITTTYTTTSSELDLVTSGLSTQAIESESWSTQAPVASSNNDAVSSRPAVLAQGNGSGEGRPAKRKRTSNSNREDVRPTIEDEESQVENAAPHKRRRKPKDPNAPKRKGKRACTPDDAESQEVDRATTKMSDLTKDLRIGAKFSMRNKILEREAERKEKALAARAKEAEAGNASDGEDGNANNIVSGSRDSPVVNETTTVPAPTISGPRLRMVNGAIVLDESSLQVDRHRVAAEGAETMSIVEEDDFTRIVTSGTNQKKEKSTRWGHHETEQFYDGLKMFGTDFEMIAKTFGNKRSRRQIKLKYNKEEVENPERIHRCITGKEKLAMDLGKLKGGSKYTDTDVIKAEIAAMEKAYADEENRQIEASAEADRRKRATIAAGGAPGGRESSKENEIISGKASTAPRMQKKAPAKKSKRAAVQHMGGEDFEIVGTID